MGKFYDGRSVYVAIGRFAAGCLGSKFLNDGICEFNCIGEGGCAVPAASKNTNK